MYSVPFNIGFLQKIKETIMKAKYLIPVMLVIVLGLASVSFAAQPQDILKGKIDEFIKILRDPQYKDASQKENQRTQIWAIIKVAFDFEGISRGTVARNWKDFSTAEQKDFIDAFTDLLVLNYLKQIEEGYTDETVTYLNQEIVSDKKAIVRTEINRTNKANIPVDYSMWTRTGDWRVYDVKVEGVSLVKNYRSQFQEILQKDSPAVLIQRVKEKVAELRKEENK